MKIERTALHDFLFEVADEVTENEMIESVIRKAVKAKNVMRLDYISDLVADAYETIEGDEER